MKRWFQQSLVRKISLGSILNMLCVIGIVFVTVWSFQKVNTLLRELIDRDVAGVVENARVGRELSLVFADINRLLASFIDNEQLVQTEKERLLPILQQHLTSRKSDELHTALQDFIERFELFLLQCTKLNTSSKALQGIGTQLHDEMERLEASLTEKIIAAQIAGQKQEAFALSQLKSMLPGYRLLFAEMSIQFSELKRAALSVEEQKKNREKHVVILSNDLEQGFTAMMSIDESFVEPGETLIGAVNQYETVVQEFFLLAGEFRQQLNDMKDLQAHVLTRMGTLDEQVVRTTGTLKNGVDEIIQSSNRTMTILSVIALGLMVGGIAYIMRVVAPVKHLAHTATQLAQGRIETGFREIDSQDEIGTLSRAFRQLIASLEEMTSAATEISRGDLSRTITPRSRDDALGQAFLAMSGNLKGILQELDHLTLSVRKGELSYRSQVEAFDGDWRSLVSGMNEVIEAFVQPIGATANSLDLLAKGELPEKISTSYQGDFNHIRKNLNRLIETTHETTGIAEKIANGDLNITIRERSEQDRLMQALAAMIHRLKNVLQEMADVTQAIQAGTLSRRGTLAEFSGGWRQLIGGVNDLIEAFVLPIHATSAYIEELSEDTIPSPILGDYQGDFNKIKQNLNLLGDKISGVLHETDRLILSVQEGKLDVRGDADRFGGGWRELVLGINSVLDAFAAPVQIAATTIDRIAKGDIPEKIVGEYQGDFDRMTRNLNALIEASHDITQLAEEMASGNLMLEIRTRSESDRLMSALSAMLDRLNHTLQDVKATADHVFDGSRSMNTIAEQVSQGNSQQAAAAEEASASMQQMVANIRQTADNAKMTEAIAAQSADDARQGGLAVAETIEAMRKIEERISIIQEISMQTNILSMNATIEAAKAQDYGKGFAVVASEVRSLAGRSREAAEEIEQLVKSCVMISEQAGEILDRLVPNSEKTANLVQEITAAGSEQYTGAEQVNNAIQQLDQVIQQNASTAEEMAASAEEFAVQVDKLNETMAFFRMKERIEEQLPAEDSSDLMHAIQTLLHAKDTDEQSLIALLNNLRKPEKTAAVEHAVAQEQEPSLDLLSSDRQEDVKDERDDEFERF